MNLRFRLQFWLVRSWPFRALALLLSKHVPESKDFGEFGDLRRNSEDTRILQELLDTAEELSKYGVVSVADMARVQTLFDEAETAHLKLLRSKFVPRSRGFGRWDSFFRDGPRVGDDFLQAPLFAPQSEHPKTNDEFEKLKARRDEHGLVRRTPAQLQADRDELAKLAVGLARFPIFDPDKHQLFKDLPPPKTFEHLEKRREAQRIERWKTILAVSAGAAGVIAFAIAIVALVFTR